MVRKQSLSDPLPCITFNFLRFYQILSTEISLKNCGWIPIHNLSNRVSNSSFQELMIFQNTGEKMDRHCMQLFSVWAAHLNSFGIWELRIYVCKYVCVCLSISVCVNSHMQVYMLADYVRFCIYVLFHCINLFFSSISVPYMIYLYISYDISNSVCNTYWSVDTTQYALVNASVKLRFDKHHHFSIIPVLHRRPGNLSGNYHIALNV